MRFYNECIPCFDTQLQKIAKMLTEDPDLQQKIIAGAKATYDENNMNQSPPYFAQKVHREIRAIANNPDPYLDMKRKYNEKALEAYPKMKALVNEHEDPFRAAALIATVGNVIDIVTMDLIHIENNLAQAMGKPPAVDQIDKLAEAVENADTILYLGDNAGETVMDRVFIEQFPAGKNIVFAVRGAPILNDATMEDAIFVGLDKVAKVIPNGSDAPGTLLEDCTKEFCEIFHSADLVISKGMGNYESLAGTSPREIFFMLLIKCDLVARHIGAPKGESVVMQYTP